MNLNLGTKYNCDINKPEKYFDQEYCMQGIGISKSNIKQITRKDYKDKIKYFEYEVKGGYYRFDNETVKLIIKDNVLTGGECTCYEYRYYGACKHLLSVLINDKEELLKNYTEDEIRKKNTKKFLKLFNDTHASNALPKKKLNLKVELIPTYNSPLEIKVKIGSGSQYYSLNSKLRSFINSYEEEESNVKFGKNLTYSPNDHYFDEVDKNLISLLSKIYNEGDTYSSDVVVNRKNYRSLMKILEEKEFDLSIGINKYHFKKINKNYNLNINLKKDGNDYKLTCDFENIISLYKDYKYLYNIGLNEVYKLNNYQQNFIGNLQELDTNEVVFNKNEFNEFKKSILPTIKDEVNLDEEIKKEVKIFKPKEKICLDLVNNTLMCELKFLYDKEEINYFSTKPSKVIRDKIFENEMFSKILEYGLSVDQNNKNIFINGIDNIINFVSEKLPLMMEKYDVYITDKLKNMNIRKKISAHSSFSIGRDNIMKYSFDMDDIPTNELVNILESLNQKKKYHKLKNGDIIDLESTKDDLETLENFVDDLELSQSDISNGEGILPKYKAIYIDSLKRDNNYDFIKTNNLFDKLISKFNKYKDKDIELEDEELQILRDYQKIGVRWLKNIHECGFGGILADEMGLGKSIQIIYFLLEQIRKNASFKSLIVVPTSLLYNWENEIHKFASELKYVLIDGTKSKRHELLESNISENILITTYGLLREDKEYYEKMHFDACIIDEAQNIKNVNAGVTKVVKMINADTKFALTGTPLENSVIELWSIFDYIMPGYLANYHKFSRNYNVSDFEKSSLNKLNRLNKQISSFMLRRLKKDVIKDLPKKIENKIYIDLNPHQKTLYSLELEKVKKQMNEILSSEGFSKGKFLILPLLTKLRQICIDPALYLDDYTYGSSKIDNLINVVKEVCDNGHKILLFSNFKTAIDRVKTIFDEEGITNYVIDGSVKSKKRQELVDKFNSDNTNVFLITLKAGGTGLNLTSADIVIHLDMWWNPQVENQATDRAHRIGQKNVVEVIKFVTRGTIEERIIELQDKKRKLSDKIIEGEDRDKNLVSTLTIDDIKNLLSFE